MKNTNVLLRKLLHWRAFFFRRCLLLLSTGTVIVSCQPSGSEAISAQKKEQEKKALQWPGPDSANLTGDSNRASVPAVYTPDPVTPTEYGVTPVYDPNEHPAVDYGVYPDYRPDDFITKYGAVKPE